MARTRIRSVSEQKSDSAAAVAERRRQAELVENKVAEEVQPARKVGARKPERTGGGLLSRIPVVRSVVAYFQGVASEMQKVTWPSREETSRLTSVVLGVTVAFAIGLGLLDAFYSWWFRQAFHADSEWIFLVVAAAVAVVLSGGYLALRRYI
ncbi:MAG: hypothetical protein Kow00106_20030 [Anaerolineae bacterium]